MVSRADVVAEARSWKGVGIIHRGRTRKGGVDCLGLVIVTGVGSGAVDDPGAALEPFEDYGRLPNPRRLVAGLDTFLTRACDTAKPGDVLALHWGAAEMPMHLAILAEAEGRPSIIHAYPLVRPKRVLEVSYAGIWPNRLCHDQATGRPLVWRFPKIEE